MTMMATLIKSKRRYILNVLILLFIVVSCKKKEICYNKLEGAVFGTTFHIIYKDSLHQLFDEEIETLFGEMNSTLSTYHPNSTISKLNSGQDSILLDPYFEEVFQISSRILKKRMVILIQQ